MKKLFDILQGPSCGFNRTSFWHIIGLNCHGLFAEPFWQIYAKFILRK